MVVPHARVPAYLLARTSTTPLNFSLSLCRSQLYDFFRYVSIRTGNKQLLDHIISLLMSKSSFRTHLAGWLTAAKVVFLRRQSYIDIEFAQLLCSDSNASLQFCHATQDAAAFPVEKITHKIPLLESRIDADPLW